MRQERPELEVLPLQLPTPEDGKGRAFLRGEGSGNTDAELTQLTSDVYLLEEDEPLVMSDRCIAADVAVRIPPLCQPHIPDHTWHSVELAFLEVAGDVTAELDAATGDDDRAEGTDFGVGIFRPQVVHPPLNMGVDHAVAGARLGAFGEVEPGSQLCGLGEGRNDGTGEQGNDHNHRAEHVFLLVHLVGRCRLDC